MESRDLLSHTVSTRTTWWDGLDTLQVLLSKPGIRRQPQWLGSVDPEKSDQIASRMIQNVFLGGCWLEKEKQ